MAAVSEALLPIEPGWTVGLFGGSFDPPHEGHLHVARMALERLGLDRLVWLVSPGNPLKPEAPGALERRLAEVRAMAADPRMIVSDVEARLGLRYTVDLLRALQAAHPGVRFVWIMGSDSLAGFDRWKGWEEIAARVPIAAVARPGSEDADQTSAFAARFASARIDEGGAVSLAKAPPPAWTLLRGELHPASSTAIRAAQGRGG